MTNIRCVRQFTGQRGFTVLELMIALAVGAILLVVAVPSFTTLLERTRIGSAADHLYASLAEARGEAVKRRVTVRVCPSANSATCRNDGDWNDGWLVFLDGDGNGAPNTSADIVKAVPSTSLSEYVDIGTENAVEDGVSFGATGATWDSTTDGAFWICHSDSDVPSKEISVSPSGRIEYTTRARTDCEAG